MTDKNYMSIQNLIERLEKTSKFKKAFNKKNLALEVAQMIIESRTIKGVTQEELAKKMRTHQSSIARAEKGRYLPSLSFLEKMAKAYNTSLVPPVFEFMKEYRFSFKDEKITGIESQTRKNDAFDIFASDSAEGWTPCHYGGSVRVSNLSGELGVITTQKIEVQQA